MVLGVVCEYNPFHQGHLYQLAESRRAAGEGSTIVCAMSGDFVQRGEAAICAKFARAEAAVACGADLVAELPLPWCLSSAEGFARGAVGLLNALGAERLCFGSETGELEPLEELARLLQEPDFLEAVKNRLAADGTLSFAEARQQEAEARQGESALLLSQPNNILGVEYCKALAELGSAMRPFAVLRQGNGHDQSGKPGTRSASELRRMLVSGTEIAAELPPPAAVVFRRENEQGRVLRARDALELPMLSRLRMLGEEDFLNLPDAADGLGQRLFRAVREEPTLDAVLASAKTRRYALSRIRRMALCACLGVKAGMADGIPPYARVLAANERGRALLREQTKRAAIPIVTKPATVKELSEDCAALFTLGAQAHDFYVLGFPAQVERRPGGDWRTSPKML